MLLQHYWWFIVSLLAAVLVFLLFVQGGQGLLYCIGRSSDERNVIVGALGRKWELTFTTLVTFGGAFFASFPLFYSTSFGGAFYVWMLILFVFVIQAVAYEYRRKPNNFLGERTFDAFLQINGILGALLLGMAVGTLFTGAPFTVDRMNLTLIGGSNTISQWSTPWRGLDALADYRNWALGLSVLFLSRVLGLQYMLNAIEHTDIQRRARRHLLYNATPFLVTFLTFLVSLLLSKGWGVEPSTGEISIVPYKYWHNVMALPWVSVMLLLGIASVLWSIVSALWGGAKRQHRAIWWGGGGTILTVLALLLLAGWGNTAYYPSTTDMQSSLTIYNSSSSQFTLTVMSYTTILIPFVIAYIIYAWRAMNKKAITTTEIDEDPESY